MQGSNHRPEKDRVPGKILDITRHAPDYHMMGDNFIKTIDWQVKKSSYTRGWSTPIWAPPVNSFL